MVSRIWNLEEFVRMLDSWGMMDVFLPFLLIFTIIFAILMKVKVFGERKNINAIVALVFGLIVVIPHVTGMYPADFDVVLILNQALPAVSIVIVAIIMLLILIGIFGGEASMFGLAAPTWIGIISIFIILFIFGGAAGWWGGLGWFESFFGSDAIAIIIMLLIFGIIISFITHEGKTEELGIMKRAGIDFGKLFGKQ